MTGPSTIQEKLRRYHEFLRAKTVQPPEHGFIVDPAQMNPLLKPHQRDIVRWAVHRGRAAIFAAFGLGKTPIQLEIMRLIFRKFGGRLLIVAPLGVRQEFRQNALLDTGEYRDRSAELGLNHHEVVVHYGVPALKFIRTAEEADHEGIYLTNYESVRDGRLDVRGFTAVSLDEAACLRERGTKTFWELRCAFERTPFRFVATATPSPNEFLELLSYAWFLDVMDFGQAKTRFFKRNSEKSDHLTLHPHKEREFWLWLSTWAVFLQRPSDLGYSDAGYELPPLEVHWHELPVDRPSLGATKKKPSRQGRLVESGALGVIDAAREKRDSVERRLAKLLELRQLNPAAHRLIWHDLEAERHAIERAIPGVVTVFGSQDLDRREQSIIEFSDGRIAELAAKPVMAGSGCNFQRHCAWAIFFGIGFKFKDFIQAVHRIRRYLQTKTVRIDIIYTEREREVRASLEAKWEQHNQLTEQMSEIIRAHGLAANPLLAEMERSLGVPRVEFETEHCTLVNNDAVEEFMRHPADNSAGLILTSIPFAGQYEYTPTYNDFGHTDDNAHFFEQMDFLTPELLRVLMPGRVAAVHVKDRIVPGAMTGLGFQTVYSFHADVERHFRKHGFAYLGMKTIVTDVVRENTQTYRLGWTEQCKDGSRMGVGLPEYLLLFRKPVTDPSNGYADLPVAKDKTKYMRARWQIDAHGFTRSNGDRLLTPADMAGMEWKQIFRLFRQYSLTHVYDFEQHVAMGEVLEREGRLPPDFMLMPPQSWHPDVWTDITRMLSLNSAQASAGRIKHICPLQFDIVDRVIAQFSMPGELVVDPFGGLMTVPFRAVKLGRRAYATELSHGYWLDGCQYVEKAERDNATPSLFDVAVFAEEEVTA